MWLLQGSLGGGGGGARRGYVWNRVLSWNRSWRHFKLEQHRETLGVVNSQERGGGGGGRGVVMTGIGF